MGVQTYLLDRRMVTLFVGSVAVEIGTLRQYWKVTEIDNDRAAEIDAVKARLSGKPAPVAVMVADVAEMPLANAPGRAAAVHLVLGWDEDRSSVTDFAWEYLPVLGYAVKMIGSAGYALHEEQDGVLHALNESRASAIGIFDASGRFIRRGQPSIIECRTVKPYINRYVEASCLLSDGQSVEVLTSIGLGGIPLPIWYKGKRPADVAVYEGDDIA
jgi:hypothetical protein